jgi:tripartite-type tricarboxylate transporter receptor subunit TctC
MAAGAPILIVSRKDLPATDFRSLVAAVKAGGDTFNQAHAGIGSVSHTTCTMFNVQVGTKPTLVPDTGTDPVLNDMIAGKVDYVCEQIVNLAEQIKAGSIKA